LKFFAFGINDISHIMISKAF